MNRDDATLLDLARAARLVRQFAAQTDGARFEEDLLVQSAILHQLLVLGEAAKRLSEPFRAAHPDVPWTLIARMRDRLIHGYDTVDLQLVWQTVERDVSALLAHLEPLLPSDPA